MKTLVKILVVATCVLISKLQAQDFQGVATYKSHRKVDLKMDESKISSEQQKSIQAQLKKQFQREYTLEFSKYESVYKQEEKLDAPQPVSSGINIKVVQGADVMYKNVKEHRYTNKTEIYGKRFLIKDSLTNRKWELVNETKNIGEYTCYKAIFKDEITSRTINEQGEFTTVTRPRITTVWYTPQIPVSNGPSDYFGLPGLILEVNDGKLTLVCTRIVISPEQPVEIVEPQKGKEVSQKEFDEIRDKKMEEMMEQFRSTNRGRSDGNRVMIRVGG
ncbi:GLPGLI family protein [Hyunsoonleella flava]|uniref:GLPGLI family protein n=1 Tax=Hyunsoonleella flava TaxID=2527939 RepID=A0A4Q9FBB0_9FLAO|nr:GLPGLI family protein [Hyunsoonleella flava]TBN02347.1 GLPGLI family protein [Hyunsoonleella flava]